MGFKKLKLLNNRKVKGSSEYGGKKEDMLKDQLQQREENMGFLLAFISSVEMHQGISPSWKRALTFGVTADSEDDRMALSFPVSSDPSPYSVLLSENTYTKEGRFHKGLLQLIVMSSPETRRRGLSPYKVRYMQLPIYNARLLFLRPWIHRDTVVELMVLAGVFNIGDFVPALDWLDLKGVTSKMKKLHKRFDGFMEAILEEHKAKGVDHKQDGKHADVLSTLLSLKDNCDGEGGKLSDTEIKALLLQEQTPPGPTPTRTGLRRGLDPPRDRFRPGPTPPSSKA
ncbi:Flavonoid 3'-monooxygenase-like protein [Drosera capensis]